MHKLICLLLSLIAAAPCFCENQYILHDSYINELYLPAINYFGKSDIFVIRDPRGIIIRFEIKNPEIDFFKISNNTANKITRIETFLAKNKNPVIMEVHTSRHVKVACKNLKSWEISSVIAGNIAEFMQKKGNISGLRVFPVGYGEFLPEKNTPNNGGNLINRVDIILLCNVSGE